MSHVTDWGPVRGNKRLILTEFRLFYSVLALWSYLRYTLAIIDIITREYLRNRPPSL